MKVGVILEAVLLSSALLLAGCGGGGSDAPPPQASAALVSSGSGQSAIVGQALTLPVVVTLTDAQGRGVASTPVTATLAAGSGSLSASSFTTDTNGRVSISGWTLGNRAGVQSMTVKGGLAEVTVTATALAGPASKLLPLSANPATATVGASLAGVGVTAFDAFDNVVSGGKVDFTVAANNGKLSEASVNTDASGVAKLSSWTLGPLQGTQKLSAKLGSLAPLEISVTADLAAGCVTHPVAVGLNYSAAWTGTDCADAALGRLYDEYSLKLDAATNFKMQISGIAGRQFRIFAADGKVVGAMPSDSFAPAAADPLEMQYALGAGDYKLRAYSDAAKTAGAYSLKLLNSFSNAVTETSFCRPIIFASYGASVQQKLTRASSCPFLGGFEDRYVLLMTAGEKVTLKLESAAFAPRLFFRDDRTPTSPILISDGLEAPGTATVTWTATFSDFHEIIVTSRAGVEGDYKLTIQRD